MGLIDILVTLITFILGLIIGVYFTKKIKDGVNKNIKKK